MQLDETERRSISERAARLEARTGVQVLVAPQKRRMHIEVGYGLEGTLTDVASSRISRNLVEGNALMFACYIHLDIIQSCQINPSRSIRFGDAVYVLHCFQKKSTRGIETPKPDMDLIRERLKAAETHAKGTAK
jgi:hypothetical protein